MEPVTRTAEQRSKRNRVEVPKQLSKSPIEITKLSFTRGGQMKKPKLVEWNCPNGCGAQKRYRNQCDTCLHPRTAEGKS